MKTYSQVNQKIRHRFLEIRGAYSNALELMLNAEKTKEAIVAFGTLLSDGAVCIIRAENGFLDIIDLPRNIDLSKIPQTTVTRL